VNGEVAVFSTRLADYIYQRPLVDSITGAPVRDRRLRRYNVYQADQSDARLYGAEGRVVVTMPRLTGTVLDATVSWVQGDQRAGMSWAPLPAMPPLRSRVQLRRDGRAWSVSAGLDAALRQRRVPPAPATIGAVTCLLSASEAVRGAGAPSLLPAEFCPTDGWVQGQASVSRRWLMGRQLHEITTAVDNLFNTDWRDHLWRAKQVAPQPGRNLRLLYRWSW
jgi:iron complex outermembrane receptor protein